MYTGALVSMKGLNWNNFYVEYYVVVMEPVTYCTEGGQFTRPQSY